MAAIAYMDRRGQVTIPEDVRTELGLAPGHPFEVEIIDDGILIRPIDIDPEQAWFWTPEWQAKEREADADIAAGRVTRYESTEEFLASLDDE